MRLYVVLDKTSKIEYGVTNKLWLARLFVIQRYDTNKNLTIDCRKSKKSKHDLIYHDLNLYYFSGFALLYEELQYIHSNIFDAGIQYYRKKYKQKSIQRKIDTIEKGIIRSSIHECIYHKCDVTEKLHSLHEWKRKVGSYDYCN